VVVERIRNLSLTRGTGRRIVSLRLDLEDDSVTLRDLQGMESIFEAAAQGRPEKALIEVAEIHLDWGEPAPWIVLAVGLFAVCAAAFWLEGVPL